MREGFCRSSHNGAVDKVPTPASSPASSSASSFCKRLLSWFGRSFTAEKRIKLSRDTKCNKSPGPPAQSKQDSAGLTALLIHLPKLGVPLIRLYLALFDRALPQNANSPPRATFAWFSPFRTCYYGAPVSTVSFGEARNKTKCWTPLAACLFDSLVYFRACRKVAG